MLRHLKTYFQSGGQARLPIRLTGGGQAVIEFTFSLIIIALMVFSLAVVFRWTGLEMAGRRKGHEDVLTKDIDRDYTNRFQGQGAQLDSFFYKPSRMNAVFQGGL